MSAVLDRGTISYFHLLDNVIDSGIDLSITIDELRSVYQEDVLVYQVISTVG